LFWEGNTALAKRKLACGGDTNKKKQKNQRSVFSAFRFFSVPNLKMKNGTLKWNTETIGFSIP